MHVPIRRTSAARKGRKFVDCLFIACKTGQEWNWGERLYFSATPGSGTEAARCSSQNSPLRTRAGLPDYSFAPLLPLSIAGKPQARLQSRPTGAPQPSLAILTARLTAIASTM